MRVKVAITLDVDEAAWAEEYGVALSEVREDVKRWAATRIERHDDDIATVVSR